MLQGQTGSWPVSIDDRNQVTHALLFVRDAHGLTPRAEEDVPPRLLGDVPDLTSPLTAGEKADASAAWLDWWRRVIGLSVTEDPGALSRDTERRSAAVRAEAFDFPLFASLDVSHPLQAAARASYRQALGWRPAPHHPKDNSRWQVMKGIVDELCATHQVSPGQLNASIIVLAVEGPWSATTTHDGVLLVSSNAFSDETLFAPLLRETFIRGLSG